MATYNPPISPYRGQWVRYNLDSLKYIGLIATLNGTDVDSKETIKLKSYDQKVKSPRAKR